MFKVYLTKQFEQDTYTEDFNLHYLQKGVYVLRIQFNENTSYKKLIVE